MSAWAVRQHGSAGVIRALLARRDIPEHASELFLFPDFQRDTFDPMRFRHMPLVIERMRTALARAEQIVIFGDYDADGTCGAMIMKDYLDRAGHRAYQVYQPDRYAEGYGLKRTHVHQFHESGATLLITIDCGVTSLEEIAYANSLGIDVMVLDHHIVPPVWPAAYAIINPKHPEEEYPNKDICGSGLSYKVVEALVRAGVGGVTPGWERWLLDLVAIATVADMMDVRGENRALITYGIQVIRKGRRPGLKRLLESARVHVPELSAEDIAFMVAPRINAASRMRHASIAADMLTARSAEQARELVGTLEGINTERKLLVEEIVSDAHGRIARLERIPEAIVVGDMSWPPGVLGIVATRIMEVYHRPVFVWGSANGVLKGSCRAYGEENIVDAMRSVSDGVLLDFGGHQKSGGFALIPEQLTEFQGSIESFFVTATPTAPPHTVVFDGALRMQDLTTDIISEIRQLEPHGIGNPRPVFVFPDVRVSHVKEFGKIKQHVRCVMTDGVSSISALQFFARPPLVRALASGSHMDIAGSIELGCFGRICEPRVRIIDVRPAGELLYDTQVV
ncbi:MAG: single-stranded-DNA-specific exonuclease RecJ [Patescibacteria group bacterium]